MCQNYHNYDLPLWTQRWLVSVATFTVCINVSLLFMKGTLILTTLILYMLLNNYQEHTRCIRLQGQLIKQHIEQKYEHRKMKYVLFNYFKGIDYTIYI